MENENMHETTELGLDATEQSVREDQLDRDEGSGLIYQPFYIPQNINGIWYITYFDKKSKTYKKAFTYFRGKKIIQDMKTGLAKVVWLYLRSDGTKGELILPLGFADTPEAKKEFGERIMIQVPRWILNNYMAAEIERLQNEGKIEYDLSFCDIGIAKIDEEVVFNNGIDIIKHPNSPLEIKFPFLKTKNARYRQIGNLSENLDFIYENYKTRGIWCMHFISLGSPIFSLLEESKECRLIALVGGTRTGKTTAIQGGLHNWGYAQQGSDGILLSLKATANSIQEKLAGKHIFQGFTDFQSDDKKEGFKDSAPYTITDGITKSRLNKDGTEKETRSYSGYIALGSEEEIIEKGKSHGRNARVLQIQ